MSVSQNERLLSLDVARGIAALCVVVFHWAHFYRVIGVDVSVFQTPALYPLRSVLALVYRNGWMGVEFFFVLSGAIFFTKYRGLIAERTVGPWRFFVLRFSRLYPLYFLTLIGTALLQMAMIRSTGSVVVYPIDVPYFLLNLLFVQNWFSHTVTFNAPAWSLSVEAFLYVSFFLLVRFTKPRVSLLLALAGFGLWLYLSQYSGFLGRGLWGFYLGGAAVTVCAALPRRTATRICLSALPVLIITDLLLRSMDGLYVVRTLAFVCIVAALAMNEDRLRSISRPLAFLGDISYSSYLLHFPLQLAFILGTVLWFGSYRVELFYSPWMMAVFLAALILLSLASFHLLEVPARRAIRAYLAAPKRPLPASRPGIASAESAPPIQPVLEPSSSLIPDQVGEPAAKIQRQQP